MIIDDMVMLVFFTFRNLVPTTSFFNQYNLTLCLIFISYEILILNLSNKL